MKFSLHASSALGIFCVFLAAFFVYFRPLDELFTKEYQLTAVIVENHEDARPHHEGLDKALLIEEWMVEGLISRLMAIYNVGDLPWKIGPVRSLRPYFLEALFPWNMAVFHAGGSPEALEMIASTSTLAGVNGIGSYNELFTRAEELSPPHDLFIHKKAMKGILEDLTLEQKTPWPPYEEGRAPQGPVATTIDVNFYNDLHNIQYTYDLTHKHYTRMNGDQKSAAKPKNVLLLEVPIQDIVEYGRLEIAVQGRGNALLFRSGKVYEGRWQKNSRGHEWMFTDKEGEPLLFAYGQTWMTVLPTFDRVSWEEQEE